MTYGTYTVVNLLDCQVPGSSLSSCVKPVDDLPRGDDGDALMGTDVQQMLAIPGDIGTARAATAAAMTWDQSHRRAL